jgi:butyrate kinase
MRLLIINPGSTSTKIAVYDDEREVFSENIAHSTEEVGRFNRIVDQKSFRKDIILKVRAFAAIVAGANCPAILTSRSDSEDSKFFSIALGSLMV